MRKFLLTTFLLLCSVWATAQITADNLSDPLKLTVIHHPYYFTDLSDTPAPSGYKPFYISHYGRHGSRYSGSSANTDAVLEVLNRAQKEGNLTAKGKELLSRYGELAALSDGMWGELSALGAVEHKAIAARMYARFKPVWTNRDRKEVNCVSSHYTRCITSMANSTNILARLSPELDFSFVAGRRYFNAYICTEAPAEFKKERSRLRDEYLEKYFDGKEFYGKIFTDPGKALAKISNPKKFCYKAFESWSIVYAIGIYDFDIRDYFTSDELLALARSFNNNIYYGFCRGIECSPVTTTLATKLLAKIIEEADLALEPQSHRAADLRYGHDSGLLPLLCLMRVEGYDGEYHFDEASDHVDMAVLQPMGMNLQMVFYRKKSGGDILVKMLVNEKEVTIPCLAPENGPYYKWDNLKKYFSTLL